MHEDQFDHTYREEIINFQWFQNEWLSRANLSTLNVCCWSHEEMVDQMTHIRLTKFDIQ